MRRLSGSDPPRFFLPLLDSLKVKFVGALILLVSVVIGASTLWTLSVHREHMIRATEEKGRALTDAIDRGTDAAMQDGRHQDVQRILERVGRDADIEKVIIFDTRGKIIRSSRPELVGRVLERDRLSRYLEEADFAIIGHYEDGKPVQSIVKKIRNRPECHRCHGSEATINGVLHLDMSFRRTQEQIEQMERTALWTMLLTAAVLAAGGAALMVRLVERPVDSLIRTMARVEDGDLEARAQLGTTDEVGKLAESFNTMVDRLKAARDEIEGYHQQRLARAEHLATIGEVAASLAHEIKNPLAGIAGAIQVMADELPESEPRKEIMREIIAQVHRLDRTVRDLLAFARPGQPDLGPCDVHQTLDRVLLLLAEAPEAKRVRVLRAYQPNLPRIQADAKQLGQVFLNLLLNAVQAMPNGGQITLETRVRGAEGARGAAPEGEDRMLEVAITDTGPGIPPHIQADLFKPFVTTKRRGTGLGLSVSRRIVEDHGGRIEVESPAGKGATFRVCLPLEGVTLEGGERRA